MANIVVYDPADPPPLIELCDETSVTRTETQMNTERRLPPHR